MKHIKSYNNISEGKLQNTAKKYLDYYYLKDDISLTSVREMYELIEDNSYRGFATFADKIEHFEDLDCIKIALMNYPPVRFTKRTFKEQFQALKDISNIVDEVEFPWDKKYLKWGKEHWRNIVLESISSGLVLRPMLELGLNSIEDVKADIEFLNSVGIRSIMTSSGLYPEITTIEKWEEIKGFLPRIFEVKVGGILTLKDVNKFLDSDVDLAATTISIATVYGMDNNDDDDEWTIPTNYN